MNLLLMGTFNLCEGNPLWKVVNDKYPIRFAGFNSWSSVLSNHNLIPNSEDVVVWTICLEDVINANQEPSAVAGLSSCSNNYLNTISGLAVLVEIFLNKNYGKNLVVIWFSKTFESAIQGAIKRPFWEKVGIAWDEKLRTIQTKNQRLLTIPIGKQFAQHGLKYCIDARNFYAGNCHLSLLGIKVLVDCLKSTIERLNEPPLKVLALDCDNTLWGGIVGEDGVNSIQLGEDGSGKAFQDFQIVVKNLGNNGVILVLVSKNNEIDVWNVFEKHAGMKLQKGDIVSAKINWDEKSKNLMELSDDLGLGLNSFVFWDDNPLEREKVKSTLPEITVPDVPKNVVEWPAILSQLSCFHRFETTTDDLNKQSQYRARAQFKNEISKSDDHKEYLSSLQLKPKAYPLSPTLMARAEQLCLKTNQFNLRTQRHNRIKLEEMCQSGDFIVFIASLKDRHGDHGNVGLVIAQKLRGIPAYFIDTFLVSCRVLGKHLESWMLSYLKKCIQEMEGKYLVGEYIPTEKNQVAGNFLTSHGFIPLNPDTIPISLVPCESQQNQENNLLMADVGNLVIPNLEIYNA